MNLEAKRDQVPEPPAERARRARVLAALGDPTRLAVVDLLQVQDLSPDALAAALEVPGNLLAHHLKVLESAGVVNRHHSQRDRRRTYVRLLPDSLEGLLPAASGTPAARVVFVCTHNSARSVLAEALWQSVSDVPAASAGSEPAERVNPQALAAAARAGLAVAKSRPESVEDVLRAGDVVVTVCDAVNESLDIPPHLHWSVPDPAAIGSPAAFDEAITDLRERVTFLAPRITQTHPRRAPR
ncbi:MAG: helix-turn-helix domain-containing protein [Actinomycetota bacterium]|nr:helix-turn-helix domain-containing protein [Actinomycetota bacterium]